MNCPSCGKEMERGILYTELGRGLFFLPPDGKVGFGDTKRSVEQRGGIVLDGPHHIRGSDRATVHGYVCRACKKILIEY